MDVSRSEYRDKFDVVIDEIRKRLLTSNEWRLDWLGDVRRHARYLDQHEIDLFFSPLNRNTRKPIIHPESANVTEQEKITVGVGYLPMLHIGAVFKQGRLVPKPVDTSVRRTFSLTIGDQSIPSESLCLSTPIDRFLPYANRRLAVGSEEFRIGGKAWQQACRSQLVCIQDSPANCADPNYLMIPSIEVARFFFCTSTVFSRYFFADCWSSLHWAEGDDFSNSPNEISVGLNPIRGLRYRDARQLGLMRTDRHYQLCLYLTYQSLQSTSKHLASLEAYFPIKGNVRLEAECIEIDTGTSIGKRYFVTRLLKCEWEPGFHICYAHPRIHPGQGENHDDTDLIPTWIGNAGSNSTIDKSDGSPLPVGTPPDQESSVLTDHEGHPLDCMDFIGIDASEDRFPSLRQIPTPLSYKPEQKYRNTPPEGNGNKIVPIETSMLSTARPKGSDNSVAPASIDTDRAAPTSSTDSSHLSGGLKQAAKCLNGELYTVTELPDVPLANAGQIAKPGRSWLKIKIGVDEDTKQSIYRSRHLFGVLILKGRSQCILLDIERRKDAGECFSLFGFAVPSDTGADDLLQFVTQAVAATCSWPKYNIEQRTSRLGKSLEVRSARIHHFENEKPDLFAARIEAKILHVLVDKP